jgi:EAL domain-containing protein (putative c-di-GMP-specific phosphodiesterase class I)
MLHTHIVKIDRSLIAGIDKDERCLRIVKDTKQLLSHATDTIVVEGVETAEELQTLYALGFRYFQGYFLAKPGFEHLPEVDLVGLQQLLQPTEACAKPSV